MSPKSTSLSTELLCQIARPEPSLTEGDLVDLAINARASAKARHAAQARAASKRRRYVDPATCDRDYSESELEFMKAMQAYKQRTGTPFPSWAEVLAVIEELGYKKRQEPDSA